MPENLVSALSVYPRLGFLGLHRRPMIDSFCLSVNVDCRQKGIKKPQLLQLCTARTAWSESDQAVRTVHS